MNGEHVEAMPAPKTGQSRYKRERETTIQDAAPRMSKSFRRNLISSKTESPTQTFLGLGHASPQQMQISDFLFFALFQKVTTKIAIHYKSKKKEKISYVNHQRWNDRSHQRSLGFRISHCLGQLTGADIYIKLKVTYNGERKIKSA